MDILNNPSSRNVNGIYIKVSSQDNLSKKKENLGEITPKPKNTVQSKIVITAEKNCNTLSNQSQFKTNETLNSLKSLKYCFDINRTSIPSISAKISISEYTNKSIIHQQIKNKMLSPTKEIISKNRFCLDKNLSLLKEKHNTCKLNSLFFTNNIISKHINTMIANENNSTIFNKEFIFPLEATRCSNVVPNKNAYKENQNQNLSTTKILNNSLMSYLAKNKKKNLKYFRNKIRNQTKNKGKTEKVRSLINKTNSKITESSINGNIMCCNVMNKDLISNKAKSNPFSNLPIYAQKVKSNNKILTTEISINSKDFFTDRNNYLSEEISKRTLIDKPSDKLSEKDTSTKAETSNKKSPSQTNNNNDNSPDNSNRNTGNYNTLINRKIQVHCQPNHQKHSSVIHSKDYLKEIRLNIDDNLKNLFNFTNENYYFKDKEHSDLLSNSDDEMPRNKRKHLNNSQLNEFQTEELSNANKQNDIMYTNEISFDEIDEKLKNIVFRKN